MREAATRLKVGKTALYEALRAESQARVAVAGIRQHVRFERVLADNRLYVLKGTIPTPVQTTSHEKLRF